ncbi:hypothetical protein JCM3770_007157 [Rhodotorula araucariae]
MPAPRRTSLPLSQPLGAFQDATPLSSPTAELAQTQTQTQTHVHSYSHAGTSRRLSHAAPRPLDLAPTSSESRLPHRDHEQAHEREYLPPDPPNLARLAHAVVPSRQGSVLSRGLVLKADYRFSAHPPNAAAPVPLYGDVTGASNLRDGRLGVWGLAQPTATGVRSLLALLGSNRDRDVVWFVTREEPILYIGGQPYVLREAAHPTETYSISDRAENLEEIEARLKHDVLRESARYGGLLLIHSEPYTTPDGGSATASATSSLLRPSWVAVSPTSVLTARELFADIAAEGFRVSYHRTPVARDQSPQDGYLDEYADRIRALPTRTALVFNCGAGVVRSTFAMSVAVLVRRRMLVEHGRTDPYAVAAADDDDARDGARSPAPADGGGGGGGGGGADAAKKVLKRQSEQATRDRSLLRLMHVLSKSLPTRSQTTILGLLSSQSALLENLRAALLGNFDIILSLLSTLDNGGGVKRVVDAIVDDCDAMVNLRESIVQYRVRYASLALVDDRTAAAFRQSALAALERYFFLVAFASYLSSSPPLPLSSGAPVPAPAPAASFSEWLKRRPEVARMITRLRKEGPGHFVVFAPVQDLSGIARIAGGGDGDGLALDAPRGKAAPGGAETVGDEWAEQIIRARSGIILRPSTILKNDQWLGQAQRARGAPINFRRVPDSRLYGLSQPTEDGIRSVLRQVKGELAANGGDSDDHQNQARIVWIGVREEPLVNINGTPYVLRQQAVSLRNVKSYSGISANRLELLESRLKDDVLSELATFEGRILVASEADDGSVSPVWEAVEDGPKQVKTLREVMDAVGHDECGDQFRFIRVPITAEKFPEFQDLRDIIEVVTALDLDHSAVIVNDQLGRGRTTRTLVTIKLLQDWMRTATATGQTPRAKRSDRQSYVVINNLLRVVRNGFEVKNAVDAAITACGDPFDLLDAIESARQQAEDSEGDTRDKWVARGVRELRGYFFLILFMSFLTECRPSTLREMGSMASYETWVKERPVFRTIQRELDDAGIDALTPLHRPGAVERGTASNDEVADFVAARAGRILSAYCLLKSDFFSGLQRMSLPERVDGAPNFRRVPLSAADPGLRTPQSASSATVTAPHGHGPLVYGSGMPTVDGLRHALEKMNARETKILWQSLREEPVLFVAGRPHVLRLFDRPLENVITTGVTTATVEAMEAELKRDLLREREKTGGKVLLHDEIEENGTFTVTAMWEDVQPEDILTPREVYTIMQDEGFKVDYERLPVTDEQSPIPGVFSRIERRMSSALTARDKENFSAAWNCQMGRGRTTTGMVACALVYRILFDRHAAFDLAASYIEPEDHNLHWDGREAEPLLQGEYKLVLQLVGVLKNGKLAKRLTDKAIDDMEAVQNLRTAIYSFKLRVEAAEEGTKKRAKLFDQALNYLYRYATLIVFANFLLDKASHLGELSDSSDGDAEDGDAPAGGDESTFPSFETYLTERPEIKKILSRRTLE